MSAEDLNNNHNHSHNDDDEFLNLLRRKQTASISDFVDFAGVTATAVRQRLTRLMEQGLVIREKVKAGRGRPSHRYRLTPTGKRAPGSNYADLATALWQEVCAVDDPKLRGSLLQRIATRLADNYRDHIRGNSLEERLESAAQLMSDRRVPFDVTDEGGPPKLTALACPYPDISAVDCDVCDMEEMMLSELFGMPVKLEECRKRGGLQCHFVPLESQEFNGQELNGHEMNGHGS